MLDKFKKASVGAMLLFFVFTSVFGSLVMTKPVQAGGVVTNATIDSVGSIFYTKSIKKFVKSDLEEKIKVGVMSAVMRMVSYFVQKVSYDLAVFAASGGKGQGALAQTSGFGSYMSDIGDHAVGSAIDELGNALGLNLCKPPNLSIDLTLRLGLKAKYCDPETGKGGEGKGVCQPHCTLSDFKKNWSKVGSSDYWEDTAKQFNLSIEPSQSDMGIFLEANAKVDLITAKKKEGAEAQRKEDEGAKGLTDVISGNIKTPGTVMADTYKKQGAAEKAGGAKADMGAAFSTGMKEMPIFAASVFLNTFLSTILDGFMKDGMLFGQCVSSKCKTSGSSNADIAGSYEGYVPSGGRRAAEAFYQSFLKVDLGTIDNFDLLTKFEVCDADTKGAHNCVLDTLFAQAVRRANFGKPITIAEAMDPELDLLHAGWPLRGPYYYSINLSASEDTCYNEAYCYHNIKKLRQARILPLGFEIAASLQLKTETVTLKEVVDGFHDSTSDYYHLVDPEWVLKIPKTRCDTYAYGPDPQPETNIRLQECVDLKSCVKEREDGECEEYGYCSMERNIWKFDLDPCSPHYRTCQSFTSSEGGQVGYVTRSVDAGYCDSNNDGCTMYSTIMDFTDSENPSWYDKNATGTAQIIYAMSEKTDFCLESAAGCTAFRIADDPDVDPIYLRKAPEKLGYYDNDTFNDLSCYKKTTDVYPTTKSEFNIFEEWKEEKGIAEECDKYAKLCIPEEENCNLYSPITYTGVDIPAKFNPAEISGNQITWNDQCDQSCVGYSAYQELPSNYSSGVTLDYIIPQSGRECTNSGCSAFTNLGTTSGQTEDIEYYSYLRPCVKPDAEEAQKTYITYETGEIEGYQIKTYLLVEETELGSFDNGETGAVGSPKYFYRTAEDLKKYAQVCNETIYWGDKNTTSTMDIDGDSISDLLYYDQELSPDCRQINDEKGNIYYRLLSKTIAVSNECTPYRLNDTDLYLDENIISSTTCNADVDATVGSTVGYWDATVLTSNKCKVCFQNGEYRDGFCYYEGLPEGLYHSAGVSDSCPAEENTCRSYKGNAGNNIEEIFLDGFENVSTTISLGGWELSDVTISSDSTQTSGHSLRYSYTNTGENYLVKIIPEGQLNEGESYELSFWAKGNQSKLAVKLGVDSNQSSNYFDDEQEIGIGSDWKNYNLKLNNLSSLQEDKLIFVITSQASGMVYLDNVRLIKVQEHINLVKNTLNIPLVCDANQYDNYPGEALGCATYGYNSLGQTNEAHITNFSYLCREGAVGCTELIDTYNTEEKEPRAYNVWLDAGIASTEAKITLDGREFKCDVPNEEEGCYVPLINGFTKEEIEETNAKFDKSTIYIPGEDEASTIFLVANEEASCNSADKGCTKVGKINLTANASAPQFDEMYLKLHDPDLYSDILCKERGVGCKKYLSNDGSDFYFKDPNMLGGKVCEFKEDVEYTNFYGSDVKVDGWFWKDVGRCFVSNDYGDYCNDDDDCSVGTCEKKGNWPCYSEEEDYVVTGSGYFGLWSYGLDDYDGFVGECPVEQHGCTKFIDHNDQDSEAAFMGISRDTSYYYLANEKLDDSIAECEGLAGIKGGCVLLDRTDDPLKLYNTEETYKESLLQDSQLVEPNTDSVLDANLIVKAIHDRECAAWYYCSSPDDDNGSCYALGVCQKVDKNEISGCANKGGDISTAWPLYGKSLYTDIDSDCSDPGNYTFNYRCRDVDWSAPDYSGYIFQEPGVEAPQLMQIYETEVMNPSFGDINEKLACKVYPTADSPYSRSIIDPSGENNGEEDEFILEPPFNAVNIFHREFTEDSSENDCGYRKITYGNGAKSIYLPITGGVVPLEICVGGDYDGYSEDDFNNEDPVIDRGQCVSTTGQWYQQDPKIEKVAGQLGYCVEYDESRVINNTDKNLADEVEYACLTWLPVNVGSYGLDSNGELSSNQCIPYNPNPQNGVDIDRYVCLYNTPLVKNPFDLYWGVNFAIKYRNDESDFCSSPNDGECAFGRNPISFPLGFDDLIKPRFSVDEPNDGELDYYEHKSLDKDHVFFEMKTENNTFSKNIIIQPEIGNRCVSYKQDWFSNTNLGDDGCYERPNKKSLLIFNNEEDESKKLHKDVKDSEEDINELIFQVDTNLQTMKYAPLESTVLNIDDDNFGDVHKEDIERIDVYFDHPGAGIFGVFTPALVSFVPEYMFVDEEWKNVYGDGVTVEIDGDTGYKFGKEDVDEYSWWGWMAGLNFGDQNGVIVSDLSWGKLFMGVTTGNDVDSNKTRFISNIENNQYAIYDEVNHTMDAGLGVRIWFDETDRLRGFEYALSDGPDNYGQVGLAVIIYLNNGPCTKVAQIWSGEEGGKSYAGNLSSVDAVDTNVSWLYGNLNGSTKENTVMNREKDKGKYAEYGLVEEGVNMSSIKRMGVDPSIHTGYTAYSEYDNNVDWRTGTDFEKYFKAGIPLTLYNDYNSLDDYEYDKDLEEYRLHTDLDGERTMFDLLLNKMFAKVYSVWKFTGGKWVEDSSLKYDITDPEIKYYEKTAPQIVPPKFLESDCSRDDDLYTSCGVVTTSVNGTDEFVDGFSLNGFYPGIINDEGIENYHGDIAFEESGNVRMSFYIYDNANQTPITNIRIDPNNSTSYFNVTSSFKTHKFDCDESGSSLDIKLGVSANCIEDYFNYNNTYSCRIFSDMIKEEFRNLEYSDLRKEHIEERFLYQGPGVPYKKGIYEYNLAGLDIIDDSLFRGKGLMSGSGLIRVNEHVVKGLNLVTGNLVCVSIPRVQAIDNWGWCNGDCVEDNAFEGCYRDGDVNHCVESYSKAWTSAGRVIVKPPIPPTGIGSASDEMQWDYLENFLGSE